MSQAGLNRIKLLPEHLIDQIKAGEVVERPASLLKELIENAIDAGSTRINIHLVQNGLELMAIEDNGSGMFQSELGFAFARHATSKINRFEDLYHLSSFGFRGEALASAASISRLTCTSSPRDHLDQGGKIVLHGGQTVEEVPFKGNEAGSSFYIRDLFFNTPARLKFIKSKTSEKNALKRIFYSALLSNPDVEFSLKWDEGDRKRYQKASQHTRIKEVLLGKKIENSELKHFEGQFDQTRVSGFLSLNPELGSKTQQYLFVNNRLFTDRALHQVILNTMAPQWQGESAAYAVFIYVSPQDLDVNVHPNKTQIKFFKTGEVIGVLKESIKSILPKKELHAAPPSFAIPSESSPEMSFPKTSLKRHHVGFSEGETQNSQSVLMLSANYFLKNNSYIVCAPLARTALRKLLLDYREKDAIPLLVATPLARPADWSKDVQEDFLKCGYDWEEIAEDKIALKTVPAKLGPYPAFMVAKFLLAHAWNPENEMQLMEIFLSETDIKDLPEGSYVELTDQNLGQLFP